MGLMTSPARHAAVLVALVVCAGCAGPAAETSSSVADDKSKSPIKPKKSKPKPKTRRERARYQSPEHVKAACARAAQTQDWRTYIECFSDEGLLPPTVSFLIFANTMAHGSRLADSNRFGDIYQKLKPVLEKHGLTDKAILKLDAPKLSGLDPDRVWNLMDAYAKTIKDRNSF